ncbi:hypothetical protein AGMMS49928_25180 [Spirochaetia bacterium]|nr:hypothetical protein AGMMS49928_25180 [Spirochaetia bacterium]
MENLIDEKTEKAADDLSGMNAASAKDYIFQFISTLKLTEKNLAELSETRKKWEGRIELALSRNAAKLAEDGEKEAARIREKEKILENEIAELKAQIEKMKGQLPGLAARERGIDPDLLEQELLIAQGRLPGDEETAKTERELAALEKDTQADAALEALKAKMKNGERP